MQKKNESGMYYAWDPEMLRTRRRELEVERRHLESVNVMQKKDTEAHLKDASKKCKAKPLESKTVEYHKNCQSLQERTSAAKQKRRVNCEKADSEEQKFKKDRITLRSRHSTDKTSSVSMPLNKGETHCICQSRISEILFRVQEISSFVSGK